MIIIQISMKYQDFSGKKNFISKEGINVVMTTSVKIDSLNKRLVQETIFLVFHQCLYSKQNITCLLMDINNYYFNRLVFKVISLSHSKIKFMPRHVVSSIYWAIISKFLSVFLSKKPLAPLLANYSLLLEHLVVFFFVCLQGIDRLHNNA